MKIVVIADAGAEGDSVRLSTGLMQLVALDDVGATDFDTWFATQQQGAAR